MVIKNSNNIQYMGMKRSQDLVTDNKAKNKTPGAQLPIMITFRMSFSDPRHSDSQAKNKTKGAQLPIMVHISVKFQDST